MPVQPTDGNHEDAAAPPNPGVDTGPPEVPGPGDFVPEDTSAPKSRIEDVQIALEFIELLKTAKLDDSGLETEDLDRLRNPTQTPIDTLDDPDFRLSLNLFLACSNASQKTYNAARDAILRRHPNDKVLSYDQIKRRIKHLTGIVPLMHDMCINTCLAFTGPFEKLDTCPTCSEPRYEQDSELSDEATKVPRQQFSTLPIGPQLQALWSQEQGAKDMWYRENHTESIWEQLHQNNGQLDLYDDFCCGSDYLEAVKDGCIEAGDMVLLFSIDGAQLYRNKKSECWIFIWVIFDLSPNTRYKMKCVLPGGFIGGPNNPKHPDSFIFPSLYHLSALQQEGLLIWDGFRKVIFSSKIFLAFVTADTVGMADLNGWVGHHGKYGCRLMCGLPGRHKPGIRGGHYFPAMLKPHNFTVAGCDHPDIDINNLPSSSSAEYHRKIRTVIESPNQTQYITRHREAGLCKPTIFAGLPRILPLPGCFPSDTMHLTALNVPDLLLSLWRGTMDCDPTDDKSTWDWAVLRGETWKAHGKLVADASPYIPGSYGRTPRNPAEKISSGYKAWEFLIYIYGLGPALLYRVLPDKYWRNFCKLVRGVRLILQRFISKTNLISAHQALLEFAVEFEELYYQRRVDRLHFVRQSIHGLTHLASETFRVGPPALLAQWVLERTISNLGLEIRQPSNPFANLAQRGLLCAQVNALKSMIPDLEVDTPALPHGSMDIGDGYALLQKRDTTAREVRECEAEAIRTYLSGIGGVAEVEEWDSTVTRWARLHLPNGQLARSLWGEQSQKRPPRRARNVKVLI